MGRGSVSPIAQVARRVILVGALIGSAHVAASPVLPLCHPRVVGERVVASAEDRRAAGDRAGPLRPNSRIGFAWPDTPMGVVRSGGGYAFFASAGGLFDGPGGKGGSATRTIGNLDNPLGTTPPLTVAITRNPDPEVNPEFSTYSYIGGGPVFRVPAGLPGAGRLLMVTHAEIPTPDTQPRRSFYSVLGLAASGDNGESWIALGEIIRLNHPYAPDMHGFEMGDPPLVMAPDRSFFSIYFRDWLGSDTNPGRSVTKLSVAHAPVRAVLQAAFGGPRRYAAAFSKFYQGRWQEPGIGGRSTELSSRMSGDEFQVAYNAELKLYAMVIGRDVSIAYAESQDGLVWSTPIMLRDFTGMGGRIYEMPVGLGADTTLLGRTFDVFYTWYPSNGLGWNGAELRRLDVDCGP